MTVETLTDDRVDDIVRAVTDYLADTLGINMDDDSIYEPFAEHVRSLLDPYSNGHRNWN